ncbi:MAG: hypothetical protein MJ126_05750 [Lachnospiraceae bacterium]|nr:hypothetical protein [Lachnospiraceae bacterium]
MKHFPEVEYKTIEERDAEREALLLEKQGWEKEREEYARICAKYDKLLDVASRLLAMSTDNSVDVWRKILEERVNL